MAFLYIFSYVLFYQLNNKCGAVNILSKTNIPTKLKKNQALKSIEMLKENTTRKLPSILFEYQVERGH